MFAGERRVSVGDDQLIARRAVVVATGTTAAVPPIDGLREASPWTNREATTAKKVPGRLAVLGGGAVGVELAQAWVTLGSSVVLIEALDRILPNMEEFASEQVDAAMREAGIDLRTGVKATGVKRNGSVRVELEQGEPVEADEILVAVGRRPRVDALGLDRIGVSADGYLEVDDQMRVDGSDWLYAVGDVNGRALLTHMGKYQARICADHLAGEDVTATAERMPPPQVAAVGHTLDSAREAGIEARAVDAETSKTAGASFVGRNAPGTSRLVVDEGRGVIVGATFVGPEVAEWLHAATVAVVGEVPMERLAHAVAAYPTRSEIWLKLLEAYGL